MPPKSTPKKSSASLIKCRRSERIRCKLKSNVEIQPVSSKGPVSTKKKAKLSYRKKSLPKRQLESSDEEQPTSTKEIAKLPNRKKSLPKRQLKSSDKEQSTSTKEIAKLPNRKKSLPKRQLESSDEEQSPYTEFKAKLAYSKKSPKWQAVSSDDEPSTSTKISSGEKRRVMGMDEIKERASKMCLQENEDFSSAIQIIFEDLCPDLEISEEAIDDMNIYLNHIFKCLARSAGCFLFEESMVEMKSEVIENAVSRVIRGQLGKYCIAEGRRAEKIFNEE